MKEICTCDCHRFPLFHHQGNCCKNTGKIYIKEDGEIDLIEYNKINKKESEICPCCGGSGKIESN